MLLGATVLCALVLLVLLADRLSGSVWHGGGETLFYRCEQCDLRYPRREAGGGARLTCPAGHPISVERARTSAGSVAIFACVGFLVVAVVLLVTGIVPN
jgi:hypothetical protein